MTYEDAKARLYERSGIVLSGGETPVEDGPTFIHGESAESVVRRLLSGLVALEDMDGVVDGLAAGAENTLHAALGHAYMVVLSEQGQENAQGGVMISLGQALLLGIHLGRES